MSRICIFDAEISIRNTFASSLVFHRLHRRIANEKAAGRRILTKAVRVLPFLQGIRVFGAPFSSATGKLSCLFLQPLVV